MHKLLIPLLFILTPSLASALEFNFTWDPVTTCDSPGICAEVTEYRIYEVFEDLRNPVVSASAPATSIDAEYPASANLPICFVITAYNGLESLDSTPPVCVTPQLARPSAPSFVTVDFSGG